MGTRAKGKALNLRVTHPQKELVAQAAERLGMSVSEWTRSVVVSAARQDVQRKKRKRGSQ